MKKLILSFFLFSIFGLGAQDKGSCFIEYYEQFTQRGCNPIPDGVQNVIVTVRDTKEKTCYASMGTIEVKNQVIVGQLRLKTRAGELVRPKGSLHPGYYDPNHSLHADYSIKNGVSRNFLTKDMKIVNVFFIDQLKPQQGSLTEGPDAKKL